MKASFWYCFLPIKPVYPFFPSHILCAIFAEIAEVIALGHLMWCPIHYVSCTECSMWADSGLRGRSGFTASKEWPPSFSVWHWATTTWFSLKMKKWQVQPLLKIEHEIREAEDVARGFSEKKFLRNSCQMFELFESFGSLTFLFP